MDFGVAFDLRLCFNEHIDIIIEKAKFIKYSFSSTTQYDLMLINLKTKMEFNICL